MEKLISSDRVASTRRHRNPIATVVGDHVLRIFFEATNHVVAARLNPNTIIPVSRIIALGIDTDVISRDYIAATINVNSGTLEILDADSNDAIVVRK